MVCHEGVSGRKSWLPQVDHGHVQYTYTSYNIYIYPRELPALVLAKSCSELGAQCQQGDFMLAFEFVLLPAGPTVAYRSMPVLSVLRRKFISIDDIAVNNYTLYGHNISSFLVRVKKDLLQVGNVIWDIWSVTSYQYVLDSTPAPKQVCAYTARATE